MASNPRAHRRYQNVARRVRIEQPLCLVCQAQGFTVAGAEVDHIVPLSQGGALMDRGNLQHLCTRCHDRKTQRQRRRRRRAAATVDGDVVRQGGNESTVRAVAGNRWPP